MMSDPIAAAVALLCRARSTCAMTGAGVSAESGLATFRGPDGLWKGRDPTQIATPQAFAKDPRAVWEFYNWRLRQATRADPNPGHRALAALQSRLPCLQLVTQNVDRLHQRAGSRDVIELHGNIHEVRCVACDYLADVGGAPLPDEPRCPRCRDWLRPCVVWFGESLPAMAVARAADWSRQCDVFMSIGTSGLVWPAAQFAYDAKARGTALIEINLEPTPLSPHADVAIHQRSGEALPEIVRRLQPLVED